MSRRLDVLLLAAVLAATTAGAQTSRPTVVQATSLPIRIMPLGDSITDGWEVPGGYRTHLLPALVADGFRVDLVGSLRNGPDGLADKDHEGHSGWRIDELADRIDGWLETHRPNVILLMIGTNDILQNRDLPNAPARLGALLDRIRERRPDVRVLVSTLPPLADRSKNDEVTRFNAALPSLVATRASKGARLTLVRAGTSLALADLPDGVHPREGGYAKLAAVWQAALRRVLPRPAASRN